MLKSDEQLAHSSSMDRFRKVVSHGINMLHQGIIMFTNITFCWLKYTEVVLAFKNAHKSSCHIESTQKKFVVSEMACISTSLFQMPGPSLHVFPRTYLMRHSIGEEQATRGVLLLTKRMFSSRALYIIVRDKSNIESLVMYSTK